MSIVCTAWECMQALKLQNKFAELGRMKNIPMRARAAVERPHSRGRMAASLGRGRADASRAPEAADSGPQAASKSLMVLLGDTPCTSS